MDLLVNPFAIHAGLNYLVNEPTTEGPDRRHSQDDEAYDSWKDTKHGDVVDVVEEAAATHVKPSCVEDEGQTKVEENDGLELSTDIVTVPNEDGPSENSNYDHYTCLMPKLAVWFFHCCPYSHVDDHNSE